MITRISGLLVDLNEFRATIRIGGFDHEVLLPDIVRRQLQAKVDTEVSLRTIEYLEGNPQQGRLTPRMIGFMNEAELEFFDLVCSVDGLGVKKVLRAMVRPVREIAVSIEEKDVKTLSTLPGIGPAMAERIVAKLRRKMTKFALMIAARIPDAPDDASDLMSEAFEALVSVGHTAQDARDRIESIMESGKKLKSVEDILAEIYQRQRK
ncbi:MAG TPA: helix-hairpin-helix domain-containing protein [Planctomycetaceae bacterium]|nr:helix-hairpin-helix domain-containing protein [Planctomycetaceae bacterium]